MGLEVATYLSGLNSAWPLAGDTKSQGDDHLRLIKSVLIATFPNASHAFYIPSAESFSSTITLDATDQNNLIMVDTTAGDIACTLPAGLGSSDKGWECEVVRTNTAGGNNAIVVSPASGTIASAVGSTATIRIERVYEPVRFKWTGTGWFCVKPGALIGSSMNLDTSTVPPGYRVADGTAYSAVTFAELNAILGTATLKDKRGRFELGIDASNVNMSTTAFGGSVTIGSTRAGGTITLGVSNLPPYTPTGNLTGSVVYDNIQRTTSTTPSGGGGPVVGQNNPITITVSGSSFTFVGDAQGGTSTPFSIVPPSIVTNKLVRVC